MTEKSERAGGILGDFSVSQLLATALAAATSFALSTQIGVAGSIIGAVVGAVASAVATQVYRNILASSAEKLRAIGGADETRAVGSVSGRAIVEEIAASGTPIAPPEVRDAAREREQRRIRRRVALLAAAAGVVAVLAYALVVNLATQGSGIGTKPQVVAPVAEQQPSQVQTQTQPQPTESDPSATQGPEPEASDDTNDAEGPAAPNEDNALGDDTLGEDEGVGSVEEDASDEETPEEAPSDATSEPTGPVEGPDSAQK